MELRGTPFQPFSDRFWSLIKLILKVDDKGLHFSTKTTLKSFDSFIPFEGSHDNPGLNDEPCPTTMELLPGDKFSVTAKVQIICYN